MSDDKKSDDLIDSLRDAERARRTRTMLIAGAVAVLGIGAFVISVTFSDVMFKPEIDVASGEQDVLADTNDPQCRGFIADVTAIGADYETLELELQDGLLGTDVAAIEKMLADLNGLKTRLGAAKETADQAELRFDESRREVDDWFRYVQNELRLLEKVGAERLELLDAAGGPDAGTVVAEPAPVKTDSKKTPQERLDGATLAANEAFQKFRVWHTGGLHPCGKAADGEAGWEPVDEPAAPTEQAAPAKP